MLPLPIMPVVHFQPRFSAWTRVDPQRGQVNPCGIVPGTPAD
jgi:hypothetical protein